MDTITVRTSDELLALRDDCGKIKVEGSLKIDCNVPFNAVGELINSLYVGGHLYVGGDLDVRGHLYVGDDLYVCGHLDVRGHLDVGDDLYVRGYLYVGGDKDF